MEIATFSASFLNGGLLSACTFLDLIFQALRGPCRGDSFKVLASTNLWL